MKVMQPDEKALKTQTEQRKVAILDVDGTLVHRGKPNTVLQEHLRGNVPQYDAVYLFTQRASAIVYLISLLKNLDKQLPIDATKGEVSYAPEHVQQVITESAWPDLIGLRETTARLLGGGVSVKISSYFDKEGKPGSYENVIYQFEDLMKAAKKSGLLARMVKSGRFDGTRQVFNEEDFKYFMEQILEEKEQFLGKVRSLREEIFAVPYNSEAPINTLEGFQGYLEADLSGTNRLLHPQRYSRIQSQLQRVNELLAEKEKVLFPLRDQLEQLGLMWEMLRDESKKLKLEGREQPPNDKTRPLEIIHGYEQRQHPQDYHHYVFADDQSLNHLDIYLSHLDNQQLINILNSLITNDNFDEQKQRLWKGLPDNISKIKAEYLAGKPSRDGFFEKLKQIPKEQKKAILPYLIRVLAEQDFDRVYAAVQREQQPAGSLLATASVHTVHVDNETFQHAHFDPASAQHEAAKQNLQRQLQSVDTAIAAKGAEMSPRASTDTDAEKGVKTGQNADAWGSAEALDPATAAAPGPNNLSADSSGRAPRQRSNAITARFFRESGLFKKAKEAAPPGEAERTELGPQDARTFVKGNSSDD